MAAECRDRRLNFDEGSASAARSQGIFEEPFFEELCAELLVGGAHIMTVSWHRRSASISGAAGGLVQMMVGMLVAGIGLVLAGLLAIGYGITINEFSTGNTLILAGVTGVCTGAIMLGLWVAVRELRNIARQLGAGAFQARGEAKVRPVLPPGVSPRGWFRRRPLFRSSWRRREAGGAARRACRVAAPAAMAGRGRHARAPARRSADGTEPADAAAAAKPKRNLLFSSTSRKERERAQARTSEPLPPDLLSPDLRPNPPAAPPPPVAAPKRNRHRSTMPGRNRSGRGPARPPPRRAGRTPPAFDEANGAAPRSDEQPAVTVLKSGVVDGMAYSLYSDGSIEAQMPRGHDALCFHRRAAHASRSAALKRPILASNPA